MGRGLCRWIGENAAAQHGARAGAETEAIVAFLAAILPTCAGSPRGGRRVTEGRVAVKDASLVAIGSAPHPVRCAAC